ncbi:hypothetical protein T09_4718 [Trichinella sp. T9]|nr:hypothetical protein T09_4718 [Trichinella sp. T9]
MVGPGIWQETLKKVKNEKDLEYGKKTEKRGKRGTNTVGPGIC